MHGPLNFLLIGSNFRTDDPSNGERADTIMIVHVPKDMNRAYLVSVPRDLYYKIRPYPPTHFKDSAPWSTTPVTAQLAAEQSAKPVSPSSPCGEPGNEYPIPPESPCAPPNKANAFQGSSGGQ